MSLSLVCEDDGTEVDSDEFLMTLPDNVMLMALEPGQTWRSQQVGLTAEAVSGFRVCFLSLGDSFLISLIPPRVQLCPKLKTTTSHVLGET